MKDIVGLILWELSIKLGGTMKKKEEVAPDFMNMVVALRDLCAFGFLSRVCK